MALQKPKVRHSVGVSQRTSNRRRRSAPVNVDVNIPPATPGTDANKSLNTSVSSTVCGKDQTRLAMERMEAEREARRAAFKEQKRERAIEEKRIRDAGNTGDVDFIGMVQSWRDEHEGSGLPYSQTKSAFGAGKGKTSSKICICVRKRPVSEKEIAKKDHDCITIFHPTAWIHVPKHRVDGITKYLDHTSFQFDYTFCENSSTDDVYQYTTLPLVEEVVQGKGCRATVFAYGQTGSGKTHTMNGIQSRLVHDLFRLMPGSNDETDGIDEFFQSDDNSENGNNGQGQYQVTISFFEIYGVRVQDLLNNRSQLKILEDGKGEVVVSGLEEYNADNANELLELMEEGNDLRTTHATEANDASSRSHAICQIMLRDRKTGKLRGKISLVDLAGSERGADTKSHNRQRRTESSEINKSLLALKECIRALDSDNSHVPYRSSKLTLVLKDCFTSSRALTTMIATLGPGSSSADHSLNTLRYADRVKEQKVDSSSFNLGPGAVKQGKIAKAPISGQFQGVQRKGKSPVKTRTLSNVSQADSSNSLRNASDRSPSPAISGRRPYAKPQSAKPSDSTIQSSPLRARTAGRSRSPIPHARSISRDDSHRSDDQRIVASRSPSPIDRAHSSASRSEPAEKKPTKKRVPAPVRPVTRSQAAMKSANRPSSRSFKSQQNMKKDDDSQPKEERKLIQEYEELSSGFRNKAMNEAESPPDHDRSRSFAPTVRDKSRSPNPSGPRSKTTNRRKYEFNGSGNPRSSMHDLKSESLDDEDDFEQDSEEDQKRSEGDEDLSVDSFFNNNNDPDGQSHHTSPNDEDEESDILSSTEPEIHTEDEEDASAFTAPDQSDLNFQRAARLLQEAEELLLNTHMESIHQTADLLNSECTLIKKMRRDDSDTKTNTNDGKKVQSSFTDEEMMEYAEELDILLDRKMSLITKVQKSVKQYRREARHKKKVQAQSVKRGRT